MFPWHTLQLDPVDGGILGKLASIPSFFPRMNYDIYMLVNIEMSTCAAPFSKGKVPL